MAKSGARLYVDSLLRAWARWRLSSSFPTVSAIARLAEPYNDRPFRSMTPRGLGAPADVLQVTRIMEGIARIDTAKAQAMEAVTCHYLAPGTVETKAVTLGLSRSVYMQRLSLGLNLLEVVVSWDEAA